LVRFCLKTANRRQTSLSLGLVIDGTSLIVEKLSRIYLDQLSLSVEEGIWEGLEATGPRSMSKRRRFLAAISEKGGELDTGTDKTT
jgi:hypothetical protein